MQTKYTVYYPNGNETQGEVDWPEAPSFDQINKLVNPIIGGLLEHVYVLDPAKADVPNSEIDGNRDRRDLFVTEFGAIDGSPRNEKATKIYRANWLRRHPGTVPESIAAIYGITVLFDRQIWF